MKRKYKDIVRVAVVSVTYMASAAVVNVNAEEKVADEFARGAKAWADNCTRCHNTRDPKELRDDQWRSTVYHMRVRGNLTGQDTRDILKFLQESN